MLERQAATGLLLVPVLVQQHAGVRARGGQHPGSQLPPLLLQDLQLRSRLLLRHHGSRRCRLLLRLVSLQQGRLLVLQLLQLQLLQRRQAWHGLVTHQLL